MKEADYDSRDLRLFGRRQGRYDQVRSNFYFLVRMDLIDEAAALYCTGRFVLRALDDFSIGLDQRITTDVRLFMRDGQDILEMAGIFFYVDLMRAREGHFFVAVTDPGLLSFFAISGYYANVLAREGCTFNDCFYVTRRDRDCVLIIITYFQIDRGFYRLFIIETTRRREGVTRDHVNRHDRAFFFSFRSKFSFGLTCERVIFHGRVMFDYVLTVFGR